MIDRLPVAELGSEARAGFLARTYAHLFGAILLFAVLEIAFYQTGLMQTIGMLLLSGGNAGWLMVLGGFAIVGWLASRTAANAESKAAQYAALGGYVLAEAIIFAPMLWLASQIEPGIISSAAWVTLMGFTGLTAIVVFTGKDFSFLGGILKWLAVLALVAIISAVLFGFELGTWFSVAMIGFAGAAILFDTSKVLRDYPEDRHVAAALQLFASVALLFWYVLRLFMDRR